MKKQGFGFKRRYRRFKKNMVALWQANITPRQMPAMMRDFGIWWKITRNLKDIEGSWGRALGTYIRMFKGVPRKDAGKPRKPVGD